MNAKLLVQNPKLGGTFAFDPAKDLLGSGTIGEVFRVTPIRQDEEDFTEDNIAPARATSHSNRPLLYALKRFYNKDGRDDFHNERTILDALSVEPNAHILLCLQAWTTQGSSYLLFPLADGDLSHLLRSPGPRKLTQFALNFREYGTPDLASANRKTDVIEIVKQFKGLCGALKYIHDYTPRDTNARLRRIGFHHDLKPENILVFDNGPGSTWKICDFGSGTVKFVSADSESEIYNRKESTGDPVYSAPEYVIEGKVWRAKDIWSLGCIFLEV
ncbi:protein kinase domain-containing protein [Phlyctema vagabunda]|uniref:Protein kinase domain-containing protein n=1 Tax=Phlyctema vagabunda TaxID=108571 RepID=A0ABR4P2U3_9HELO